MTTNYRPHTRMKNSAKKYNTAYGAVKIIPASSMRRDELHFMEPSYSQDPRINGGFGAPVNEHFYTGYTHEPYGQNAFTDQFNENNNAFAYYGRHESHYPGFSFDPPPPPFYPVMGAYSGQPSHSNAYRPYPQPSPPHRRSRTAPSRTIHRESAFKPMEFRQKKQRGISADPMERSRGEFGGIANERLFPKKSQPIYRKRKETKQWTGIYQDSDIGGAPLDYSGTFGRPFAYYQYPPAEPSNRRIRPFYAPSYTTYPPSTMHRMKRRGRGEKYPLLVRISVKAVQLILGAAVLGLVLGPMRSTTFHDFVIRTKTEWQGAVVGITSVFSILTAVLLLTSFLANKVEAWKKMDAHISVLGAFCFLVSAFIEAYFAACYPPNGKRINLVCHRTEWIIATVLLFINVCLYILDFVMTWKSGVVML